MFVTLNDVGLMIQLERIDAIFVPQTKAVLFIRFAPIAGQKQDDVTIDFKSREEAIAVFKSISVLIPKARDPL